MVFNSYDSMYVPFQEWLDRNIIDVDEDIIVHILVLCYEIWCARNKKCFEGTNVDVTATVQKAQRSIVNCKSASTVLLKTLSEVQFCQYLLFIIHLLLVASISLMLM